jgi:hypothetical protein
MIRHPGTPKEYRMDEAHADVRFVEHPPVLPEDRRPTSKLPPPSLPWPAKSGDVPAELKDAWTRYMVNGFAQNELMFRKTLKAFVTPYYLTIGMYGALFLVGITLLVVAAVLGLQGQSSVTSLAFGGLGAAAFLAFFIRQPVQALEENLECITWLGVAFNTYWTRLMYLSDTSTIQADLKAAEEDFRGSVNALIATHGGLRKQRPGHDAGDAGTTP